MVPHNKNFQLLQICDQKRFDVLTTPFIDYYMLTITWFRQLHIELLFQSFDTHSNKLQRWSARRLPTKIEFTPKLDEKLEERGIKGWEENQMITHWLKRMRVSEAGVSTELDIWRHQTRNIYITDFPNHHSRESPIRCTRNSFRRAEVSSVKEDLPITPLIWLHHSAPVSSCSNRVLLESFCGQCYRHHSEHIRQGWLI